MSAPGLPFEPLHRVAEREILKSGSAPLFVTVSGAHLYGFPSEDSDFDLRGCHLMPLARVVALRPAKETIEFSGLDERRQIDLVSHDAAKFFRLMLKKNGYLMEQVFSPLVIVGGPRLDELREIARRCITRHLYHHYRGFAENEIRRFQTAEGRTIKTLLYVYRVLLTGIHALRAGEIQANLPRLLDLLPQPGAVRDLIHAKTQEKRVLTETRAAAHAGIVAFLQQQLSEAFERSTLPEEPEGASDLDAFLVRLRLQGA
jgi:hypothetical protein